jgi:NitT/TauT family transport system permease protein
VPQTWGTAGLKRLAAFREEPPGLAGKALGLLCLLCVLAVWTLLTWGPTPEERFLSPAVMPSPVDTAKSLVPLFTERGLIASIADSLFRVALGFLLAVVVGVPAGILAGTWRSVRAFLAPLALLGRNVPLAALIPLTILWFGIGEMQKVMFIFIAAVPFVFSDAASAVISIPERYVETAQTLGANNRQIALKVLTPLAMPTIFTGLRHLFGLAFGYIMLAEVINAEHGLGHLIALSQRRGMFEDIYLILIIIGVLAFVIDRTLVFFQAGLFPHRSPEE